MPDLGEEIVAEVEGLGDIGSPVAAGAKLVSPGVHRAFAHDDCELEDLTGYALGDLACGPVEDRPVLVPPDVTPVARSDRRAGGAVEPLGLDDLGAVVAHLCDIADKGPDLVRWSIDVETDRSAHVSRP